MHRNLSATALCLSLCMKVHGWACFVVKEWGASNSVLENWTGPVAPICSHFSGLLLGLDEDGILPSAIHCDKILLCIR